MVSISIKADQDKSMASSTTNKLRSSLNSTHQQQIKPNKRGRVPKQKKETPLAKRRVRTGCLTCRRKHKKCDETRPKCEFCTSKNLECVWPEEVKKNVFVNNSFKDFCFRNNTASASHSHGSKQLIKDDIHGLINDSDGIISASKSVSPIPSHLKPDISSLEYYLNSSDIKLASLRHHSLDYSDLILSQNSQNNTKRRKTTFTPSELNNQYLSAFDGYTKKSDYVDNNSFSLNYPIVDRADSPLSGLFNTFQEVSTTSASTSPIVNNNISTSTNTSTQLASSGNTPLFSNNNSNSSSNLLTRNASFNLSSFDYLNLGSHGTNINLPSITGAATTTSSTTGSATASDTTKHSDSSASSITSEVSNSSSSDNVNTKKELDFEHRYSFGDISEGFSKKKRNSNGRNFTKKNNSPQYYNLPNTLKDFMCLVAATKDIKSNNKLPNNENIFEFFTDKSTMEIPRINEDEMMLLMDNYVDEVSFLLNKNSETEPNLFITEIPTMSENFPALQYALLALSSRHLEKINSLYNGEKTIQFYYYSLQQLSLSLNSSKDMLHIISTCVLLCYFEIISTEASSWRDRLVNCASMFKACGINALSENKLEQALFWSFVSLDIGCCSIGDSTTIIPVDEWFTKNTLEIDGSDVTVDDSKIEGDNSASVSTGANWINDLSLISNEFHTMLYLTAKIIQLIDSNDSSFDNDWKLIWENLNQWEINRSNSMRSCFSFKRDDSFPESLFSNQNAISSNQLFHMCCIVMLQNKPRNFKMPSSNAQKQQQPQQQQQQSISTPMSISSSTASTCEDSKQSTLLFQSAISSASSSASANSQTPSEPMSISSSISSTRSPNSSMHSINNRSQIYHAKQIIGINLCNLRNENRRNLGCQIISLQCILISSKLISSTFEHSIILKLLSDIENWCGLNMSWKGKELVEFWNSEC